MDNKTELDNQINLKRNTVDSYNKTEVDDKLNLKLNLSEFNTANQQRITVDAALEKTILDNKTELDNKINLKRNIVDSYNKTEVDDKFNLQLNLSEFNTANQQRITVDAALEKQYWIIKQNLIIK